MNGIFVIAELDGAIGDRVHALQERFDPKLAKEAPPHVTVIGSSGAGAIAPDTSVVALRAAIHPIAASTSPLVLRFGKPMRFLQREIVCLPLDPHGALRTLHERLRTSGLSFAAARYPFTPHCTLSCYPPITPESLKHMLRDREDGAWSLRTWCCYPSR